MAGKLLKGRSFLVIDDEQSTIDIVKEVLTQNGADAKGITTPSKGFGMMANDSYDAIILDRYMPDVDGHDILKQLKDHPNMKAVPVIMLTGESNSAEILKSIELGASGYVVKPFTPRSFLAQLKKILKLDD